MDLIALKQRFGIIGHDPVLDRIIHVAVQVAATDLSVLITGESGVGKENFPKIIHQCSAYKHGQYIAVNCGAIPEGTIDSELFGHEKGAFTGASEARKGYFEVADGGTIFLDEVAELPLATQVRLLRVLESGEFIRVGSSKVQKTKVRVVAATNVNISEKIYNGKFREDLYYRLNSVPIHVPPLRERKGDIMLLFTKFSSDFALKYRLPELQLTPEAVELLINYSWPGNIRQLKNITEQMSIIEKTREIDKETLQKYLSPIQRNLPVRLPGENERNENFERELIYKFLVDMKREVSELKSIVHNLAEKELSIPECEQSVAIPAAEKSVPALHVPVPETKEYTLDPQNHYNGTFDDVYDESVVVDDKLSLMETEKELIRKALEKHGNKRKNAAEELGISERTLYRKIKEFDL